MKLQKVSKIKESRIWFDGNGSKARVPVEWAKYLLVTHPVEFITTIGRIKGKLMPNIAPFATCLDTSYEPLLITFAASVKQHSIGSSSNNPHVRYIGYIQTDSVKTITFRVEGKVNKIGDGL